MADQTIEFFNKATGGAVEPSGHFVMDNEVWRDTFESCESQSAVVGFDTFVIECSDIGWRVPAKTSLDHFIDDVEAAVGAWQPIETAPRLNGQRVLLSRNGGNGPFHAIGYALDGVPGWHCNECRGMETLEEMGYAVTHWMPLPKAPGDQP